MGGSFHPPGAAASFDLVFSAFIFQYRTPATRRQRFSRFEVLMWTLSSYAKLPVERAYLFIELAPEFSALQERLELRAKELFGDRLVCFLPRRLLSQADWQEAVASIIAPPGTSDDKDEDQRLVWFLQNDDHPFIDVDQHVLREGLALLRADTSRFRTLLPTHWTEGLKLSGKFEEPRRVGSYIVSRQTLTDAVLIMVRCAGSEPRCLPSHHVAAQGCMLWLTRVPTLRAIEFRLLLSSGAGGELARP